MINDKNTNQEGGENSTNYQGQSITINQGITYQDAKNIAVDVFQANFIELSAKAAETARTRAEELVDNFLAELKERNPESLYSIEEPAMQYAIYTAQKEYARTGDKDLSDMLVDILVERSSLQERNLEQIVLDESLAVVPKLTSSQLDTLTIIFYLKYSRDLGVNSFSSLGRYLKKDIVPFTSLLSKENSLYQHLEFAGCGSVSLGSLEIEELLSKTYSRIFCNGFTKEQFEEIGIDFGRYPNIIIPCLQDGSKYQIAFIDEEEFEERARSFEIQESEISLLKPLMEKYQMDHSKIREVLINEEPSMSFLLNVWSTSPMKNMTLTSVGIALAIANARRKTGASIDLGIWIK